MSTQFPAANIITDQYPYPFSALKKLILALILGAGNSTVVWRPGGVSSGNVFATWAEVVAAVSAMNGDITIAVDTDLAPAVIPAGAWDLRPPGVSGPVIFVSGSKLTIVPTVTIANAAVTIHGLTGIEDVQIDNQSTVDVISIGAGFPTFALNFHMLGAGAIFQNVLAAGAAFIKNNVGSLQLFLDDFAFISTLGGGSGAIQTAGGLSFTNIEISGGSVLDVGQLVSANACFVFVSSTGSFGLDAYQTQAGAPTTFPHGLSQKGTEPIDVASGKTANIPAFIDANTRIIVSQKTPVGDAATVRYAALAADRVAGVPGSFKIAALSAVGGGAVNAGDTSTIDWEVVNGP